MRIGIFGGSFNPIHCGHIAIAKEMLRALRLHEIWFMVSPLNPFKAQETDLLPDYLRLDIAREALAREPRLLPRDDEFRLPRPSYTWQTLQHLQAEHPDHQFTLIIGADNWLAFDRWRNFQDILDRYPIAVYPRQGCPIDPRSLPPTVTLVDTPLHPVSSTDIRQRAAQGQPLLGLVPRRTIPLVRRYYSPQKHPAP